LAGGISKHPKGVGRQPAIASSGTIIHLRLAFLAPLTGASVLLLGLWTITIYMHERDMIESEVTRTQMMVEKMYHDHIEHDVRVLSAAMAVISRDAAMKTALARGDRAALLNLSAPLSADLRNRFGITHFYFSGPDRVNLLRAHQPERHGDVINRFTTREAERTGSTAYGVELGPLGTFTLRLVTPWYEDKDPRRLIGYVELGMEIDHVLGRVQGFTGTAALVLVAKKYLRRADWESGMRMLGRNPEWDRFPDVVLSSDTPETMPTALVDRLALAVPGGVEKTSRPQADFRVVFILLTDASGRDVGRMAVLINVSPHLASARRAVSLSIAGGALVVSVLIGFFYLLTGRIGRRIAQYEEELQQLATRDGLTGLYNRRMFHTLLTQELSHAQRFSRAVSLLMLDIDHFKRVNDTHGHQAGDTVLKGLSELLNRQARAIDHVCRYGGEEITIILPEIDFAAAANVAERLRAAVEMQLFDVGGGKSIHITVSIGVTSWPAQADSEEALIANADAAMYTAKLRGRNQVCCYQPADTQSIDVTTSAVTVTEKEA